MNDAVCDASSPGLTGDQPAHTGDFAQRIEMALRTGNRTRRDDVVALLAAYERLRGALRDAIDCVEDWGGYADDYFKEKWDLDGDLARLRAALSGSTEGVSDGR